MYIFNVPLCKVLQKKQQEKNNQKKKNLLAQHPFKMEIPYITICYFSTHSCDSASSFLSDSVHFHESLNHSFNMNTLA